MGFWDFDLGDVFGPALTAGTSLFGGILGLDAAEDQREDDRKYSESLADKQFARQKELLELQASLRPEPFTGFTDPQRVAALQGQARDEVAAINNIIRAYQRALGR